MDEEVERVPNIRELGEHGVDRNQVFDVASVNMIRRAKLSGQRRDPFAERIVLVGEGQLRAFAGQGLGYAPGYRVIIRDAHDQAAFAAHQARSHGARSLTGFLRVLGAEIVQFAAGTDLGAQASTCLNTSVAFVPPKPNEFESAALNFTLSRRARTIGMSENAGSISSICALSQMKPFCIISNE